LVVHRLEAMHWVMRSGQTGKPFLKKARSHLGRVTGEPADPVW
jgi:hypothetical protein